MRLITQYTRELRDGWGTDREVQEFSEGHAAEANTALIIMDGKVSLPELAALQLVNKWNQTGVRYLYTIPD